MTPIDALSQRGATIAMCIAWEGRPTYVAAFDAERIEEVLGLYERQNRLSPSDRKSGDAHWRQYRRLLKAVMDGGTDDAGDWLYPAGMGFLWCGFHHPALGEGLRRRGALMLREIRRTTMLFEIRDGTLFFDLSPEPLPSAVTPEDGHGQEILLLPPPASLS